MAFSVDSFIDGILSTTDDDPADVREDINLAVFVDESADVDLISCVKDALMPVDDHVRMHVEAFYDGPVEVDGRADLTIIIANASSWVGATSAISVSKSVPTVVLAQNLVEVVDNAQRTQFPLELSDVIAREVLDGGPIPAGGLMGDVARLASDSLSKIADAAKSIPDTVLGKGARVWEISVEDAPGYPDMLDALADWVMRNAPRIRTVFSRSFPFAKDAKIRHIIRTCSYQNAVTAAIFFIPGADLPIMTTNEIKMLIQLERQYGYVLDKSTIFEIAAIVLTAFMSRTAIRRICKSAPMLSWLVKTIAGYAITCGMGHAMRWYCESGRPFILPERQSRAAATDPGDVGDSGRGFVAVEMSGR